MLDVQVAGDGVQSLSWPVGIKGVHTVPVLPGVDMGRIITLLYGQKKEEQGVKANQALPRATIQEVAEAEKCQAFSPQEE